MTELLGEKRLGAGVRLRGISKFYGDFCAVNALDLDIEDGELVTLLGPSGSGKTTTLMMITGFTEPSTGEVLIANRAVSHLPPHRRDVGVVFQHYALFPHLTVAENIAFPLQMRGTSKTEIDERVRWALELVQMPALGQRYPDHLSGGQQQRVALARAIVFNPPVLLLDEPLGALDKKLRETMQIELKALHAKLGITMIYVTHDQTEALALSDRIAVMNDGQLEQVGRPEELYEYPASRFVADFVGESNFMLGRVTALDKGRCTVRTHGGLELVTTIQKTLEPGVEVSVIIRPERVLLQDEAATLENRFEGRIEDVSYVGEAIKYRIALSDEDVVTARVPNRGSGTGLPAGTRQVYVGWRSVDIVVFPLAT